MSEKPIFVVEHCENCHLHQWNTRHDEKKYLDCAANVKAAILKCCGPNTCEVVFNLVPKKYAMSDIYCQLIPNDNESDPYYQVMPRMGAMEISVNGCLLFSKCLSGVWPHYEAIGLRCKDIVDALKGDPNTDLTMFQTSGKVKAQGRKKKPVEATKLPAHMQTAKGASPSKDEPAQQMEEEPKEEMAPEIMAAPEEPSEPKEEPKPVLKQDDETKPPAAAEEAKPAAAAEQKPPAEMPKAETAAPEQTKPAEEAKPPVDGGKPPAEAPKEAAKEAPREVEQPKTEDKAPAEAKPAEAKPADAGAAK